MPRSSPLHRSLARPLSALSVFARDLRVESQADGQAWLLDTASLAGALAGAVREMSVL